MVFIAAGCRLTTLPAGVKGTTRNPRLWRQPRNPPNTRLIYQQILPHP